MANLSPQAQAVLDAALETDFEIDFTNLDATVKASMKVCAAAAIRAATDQVVPEEVIWASEDALVVGQDIRERFLAIAAELETSTTENS